jgi:hypothetical protein
MKRLKYFTLLIAAWLVFPFAQAQEGVSIGHWRTHLPYQKVIGVEPVGNKIYAATEYELFYYDTEDNSVNILNKINGLSDIGISTIRYNDSQRKLFVAYANANVDLIDNEGNVTNMSDIKDKNIVGNKRINHVYFDGDLAYVACGFGIGISLGATSFELNTNDILPIFEDDAIYEDGLITDPNQLYEKK